MRRAGDRGRFKFPAESFHRQNAPGVCRRHVPASFQLTSQSAPRQPWKFGLPVRVVQGGQHHTHGIDIGRQHQPPQTVLAFGGEPQGGAVISEPAAKGLFGLLLALLSQGHFLHPVEDAYPVEHGGCGPAVGVDGERVQHVRRRIAISSQGLNRGQLAQRKVGRTEGGIACDASRDEFLQAFQHARAGFFGQFPACLMCNAQHVTGQYITAHELIAGEISQQSITIL